METNSPEWKRLKTWPTTDAEKYLQLPLGSEPLLRQLFETERIRVEILCIDSDTREVRIPCKRGYDSGVQQEEPGCKAEIYPAGVERWAAIVSGGRWTRLMMDTLGRDAQDFNGRRLNKDDIGTKYDESQVYFPAERIWAVIGLLKPERRRRASGRPFAAGTDPRRHEQAAKNTA